MKRKRGVGRLAAIAVCVIIGLLLWRSLPHDRLLLQIASPVMPTASFRPRTGSFNDLNTPYYWLSDHEVGYFVNDAADAHRTFTVRDIATGKTQQRFTSSIDNLPWGEASKLSPDGKRLLWMHHNGYYKSLPIVYPLDGKQAVSFPKIHADDVTWTPDSAGLATLFRDPTAGGLEIHRFPDGSIQQVVLPGVQPSELLGFTPQNHVIVALSGVGFDRVFLRSTLPQQSANNNFLIRLADYDLATPAKPARTFAVAVPQDADFGNIKLSPQGDRLLWSSYGQQVAPLQRWLHRLLPAYRPPQHAMITWRVSRVDGSDMHEIGHAPAYGLNGSYSNPRWTPDGKRISFIRGNTLYTVPAD